MCVAPQNGARAGRAKMTSGPGLEARIGMPELAPVAACLLEVVAQHLVELHQFLPLHLEPLGEADVELGPRRLRECVVGGVADQQMSEPERVIARQHRRHRMDQLLAYESDQRRLDVGGMGQLEDSAAMEDVALDGAAVHDGALRAAEAVKSRLEKRLHGGRQAHVSMLAHERDHLFDEQRVPVRHRDDPLPNIGSHPAVGVGELGAFGRRKRLD